jgi:homoserine dehydrogenase
MSLESFHTSGTSPSRCRVAILGFGTVGSAVARRLTIDATHGLALTHIFDRRADLKRSSLSDASVAWTTRVDDVLASGADVIVETVGGVEPASDWIRAALAAGKSVVTANKQAIAAHLPSLWTLASRQGRQLRFEAAVGGAMPIIRAIADGLSGDRLTRIVAILNGTTNAVLSRMEALGCPLDEALADARARGYAEADPSLDLEGSDARAKLAILCALAFGLRVTPESIPGASAAETTPEDFAHARRQGGTIRQLAHAEYDAARARLTAWVAPTFVPRDSMFARATGPQNAAIITGEHCGEIAISGRGAGGDATAVAILSDLIAIARDRAAIVPPPGLRSDFEIAPWHPVSTYSTFQIPHSEFLLAEAV